MDLQKIKNLLDSSDPEFRQLGLNCLRNLPKMSRLEKAILYIYSGDGYYCQLGTTMFLREKKNLKILEKLITELTRPIDMHRHTLHSITFIIDKFNSGKNKGEITGKFSSEYDSNKRKYVTKWVNDT